MDRATNATLRGHGSPAGRARKGATSLPGAAR